PEGTRADAAQSFIAAGRREQRNGPLRAVLPTKERSIMEKKEEYKPLTREELESLAGEALPERAAMSLINANVAAPINVAAALNVLSDNSVAYANAQQTAPINQSI